MPRTAPARRGRPAFEVADIVRTHGDALTQRMPLSHVQKKALNAIARCRTAELGGHLDVCRACDYTHPAYNSCRNRHCPKCQALPAERWVAARQVRTLPVKHFHVVFTLPSELRALAAYRRKELFNALFAAASRTLQQLGRSRFGATLGITAVLHTWTRDLRFHPHLHCIVTAGGLAGDKSRWVRSHPSYLFPVRVMGALFRGKMMAALRRLHREDFFAGFDVFDIPDGFDRLMQRLASTSWVVYSKAPFAGPDHVFRYLGRYTHRVGIANSRLLAVTDHAVTFGTKHGKTVTLACDEFLRRFVQHILPHRFVKIRHFGLHAPANVKTRLATAHRLLSPADASTSHDHADNVSAIPWFELLRALVGRDVRDCPVCGCRLDTIPLSTPWHDSS